MKYSTTNREGYLEYKSDPRVCENCSCRQNCTLSKNKTKVVVRHGLNIWKQQSTCATYLKFTIFIKSARRPLSESLLMLRNALRYTNYRGLAKVKVQVVLIFSCLNLKK
ncbi:MAG: transposase [Selenomonadaceae bacterium]|nr:transposase [Selenomonadaceae bacterium]